MSGTIRSFDALNTGEFFHFLCDGFLSAEYMKYGDGYSRNGFVFRQDDQNVQVYVPNGVEEDENITCNPGTSLVGMR